MAILPDDVGSQHAGRCRPAPSGLRWLRRTRLPRSPSHDGRSTRGSGGRHAGAARRSLQGRSRCRVRARWFEPRQEAIATELGPRESPDVGQKLRDRGGQLRAVVRTHGTDHRRGRRKCQLSSGAAVGGPGPWPLPWSPVIPVKLALALVPWSPVIPVKVDPSAAGGDTCRASTALRRRAYHGFLCQELSSSSAPTHRGRGRAAARPRRSPSSRSSPSLLAVAGPAIVVPRMSTSWVRARRPGVHCDVDVSINHAVDALIFPLRANIFCDGHQEANRRDFKTRE
jgi:hypothetical protein